MQNVIIPEEVRNIPGRVSYATTEILFKANSIPPLGFKSFYVKRIDDAMSENENNPENKGYKKRESTKTVRNTETDYDGQKEFSNSVSLMRE